MSRSEVLKFRCSPEEKATLEGQLKDGQNISELIRQKLGLGRGADISVPVVATDKVSMRIDSVPQPESNKITDFTKNCAMQKTPKQSRGWGWLWWLLVAAVVLGAIWLVAQVQLYYWGV